MYKCPDCDKVYKLTKSLRKHNRQAHIENVRMTCCKFCDKVFHDSSLKAGHISSFHADLGSTNEMQIKGESGSTNKIQIIEEMESTNKIQIIEGKGSTNEVQIKEETGSTSEIQIKEEMGSTNEIQIKEEIIDNQNLNFMEEQNISNDNLENSRSSRKRLIKSNSYYRDFQL